MSSALVQRIAHGVPTGESLWSSLSSMFGRGARTVGSALPKTQNVRDSRVAQLMLGKNIALNHQMKNLTAQTLQNIPFANISKERAYRFAADPRVREALKWVPLTGAGVGLTATGMTANAVFGGETDEEKLARMLLAQQRGVS